MLRVESFPFNRIKSLTCNGANEKNKTKRHWLHRIRGFPFSLETITVIVHHEILILLIIDRIKKQGATSRAGRYFLTFQTLSFYSKIYSFLVDYLISKKQNSKFSSASYYSVSVFISVCVCVCMCLCSSEWLVVAYTV